MNAVQATARLIDSSIVIIVKHIEDSNSYISKHMVDDGCEHLGLAISGINMIMNFVKQSGHRNAPVVREQLVRLDELFETINRIVNLEGWGEKCKRFLDKKRKMGSNYEEDSDDLSEKVKQLRLS